MTILKYTGTIAGVIGALLLAANISASGWGFAAFLLSSVCWFIAALNMKEYNLAFLNFVFLSVNVFGIIRWLF